ncbi:MAG: hypothetical protein NTX92_08685 [Euryarchaeota archaeon]|nr:hypothetical protein [Euryarchaeota archaeon]
MSIQTVTIARYMLSPFEIKIAKILKRKGYAVNSFNFYPPTKNQKKIFNHNYVVYNSPKKIHNVFEKIYFLKFPFFLVKFHFGTIIAVSEPNWFVSFIFLFLGRATHSKIYFPYDISYFRYKDEKNRDLEGRICEKYNFRHCDGIIHRGPENELDYLPQSYGSARKPNIQFLGYCFTRNFQKINDDFFMKKLAYKDKQNHLIYAGQVYHNDYGQYNMIDVFRKVIDCKIHLHVYSQQYSKLIELDEYKKLINKGYFHLHEPSYGLSFIKDIAKYDWGIMIFHPNLRIMKKIWFDTTFGSKISSYMEAGLPSIVLKDLAFSSLIVEKYKIGIVISDEMEIKDKIEEIDYKEIIENIKKVREEFSFNSNIDRLIQFINSIEKSRGKI